MAAGGKSCPDDAIAIDVHAARIEARFRYLEDQALACGRSIVATFHPDEKARILLGNSPYRCVDGTRNDTVKVILDHRIQVRIERRRRLSSSGRWRSSSRRSRCSRRWCRSSSVTLVKHVLDGSTAARLLIPRPGDLSITVGIQHLTTPAHRVLFSLDLIFRCSKGRIVNLGVNPTDHGTTEFVEIHRLIRIIVELKMVCGVARVNQSELLRFGVIERCLPPTAPEREPFGVFV